MEKVDEILYEIFNLKPGSVPRNYNFRDLETWDSMGYMILVSKIETEFNIELTSDEVVKLLSIEQIEKILTDRNII